MLSSQDDKTKMEIASKLRQFRLQNLLRQSEVAKKAGINSNYYAKVERGEAVPSVITLRKILEALGVRSSDVLSF